MSRKTGIVKDNRYLQHSSGLAHPESPQRLASIYEMLENPAISWKFTEIKPREATHDEIAYIHSYAYIDSIACTAGKSHVILDPDTSTCAETYDIAKLAVGGVLNAIDCVLNGTVNNAFAFVRPPGHHAGVANSAGFCIFNNVAIGAMHAILKRGLKKILIVDWDLHHGNGTQKVFYNDRRVLYFSTHQYPFYPGTGSIQEIGEGQALGYTINVPLRRGANDASFVAAFRQILEPVALEYKPELILLSAGFDTYYQDPLGGMRVTPEGFAAMTRILLNIADKCCEGRIVAALEGGYHVAGITETAKAVLQEMVDETHVSPEKLASLEQDIDDETGQIIHRVISGISPYWDVF